MPWVAYGMANLVVLIVEDHPGVRDSIERMVEQWPNVELYSADNFLSAAIWIKAIERLDLLLSDVCLPGEMSGIDVAEVAVAAHKGVAVVMFSSDHLSDVVGMQPGYGFVQKPFGAEQLTRHIDKALLNRRLSDDLAPTPAI